MRRPKILVLRTSGTNCDRETAFAFQRAGALPERVHVERFLRGERSFEEFHGLVLPGGFSYGDDVGAGKLLANELVYRLREPMEAFVASGRPVLGICNGFQVLVRAGLLPGTAGLGKQTATLTFNDSGRFECRWVRLRVEASRCRFLAGLTTPLELPVAHAEGKFLAPADELDRLEANRQVVFRYCDAQGNPTQAYPANPNGSIDAIAGVCNPTGTVLGMMPHPERFIHRLQHPRWRREPLQEEGAGLLLFRAIVEYARGLFS